MTKILTHGHTDALAHKNKDTDIIQISSQTSCLENFLSPCNIYNGSRLTNNIGNVYVLITITSNEHWASFPAASVAVYMILVLPTGYFDPGLFPLTVRVTGSPELSKGRGSVHVTADSASC